MLEFIEELNKRHIEYVIDFEEINVVNEISDNIVGLCTYFKKVDILRRDLLPYELKLIVFHELGHAWISDHVHGDQDLMSKYPPIHKYASDPQARKAMLKRFFK